MNEPASSTRNALTDVEIGRWILAIAKHLKVFSAHQAQITALFATTRSAQLGELLLRLRGLGTISKKKTQALASDAGIPRQELSDALTRIEQITGLISVERLRSHGADFVSVAETILTEQEVFRAIFDLFESLEPSSAERILAPLLDLMSRLPLTEDEVISRMCKRGYTERDVWQALELQEAFQLMQKKRVNDLGLTLLYNEYLWGSKIERIGPIIAGMGWAETEALLALMEEVKAAQGQPIDRLTSAPQHIVTLAARTGIVDTTTITTADHDEKTFVFSPHFYGYQAGMQQSSIEDSTDQVKLFVASMTYGVEYSKNFRLHSPLAFVERLLRDGEAGNATPILRDYILLERQGIVTVREASRGRGTLVLQKPDVVERAYGVMESGVLNHSGTKAASVQGLDSQREFRPPEANRVRLSLAQQVGKTDQFDEEQIIGLIREKAQGGSW